VAANLGGLARAMWEAKTEILQSDRCPTHGTVSRCPLPRRISSEVTRYGNSTAQIYANQRQNRYWLTHRRKKANFEWSK
jgi:hypothetical protein